VASAIPPPRQEFQFRKGLPWLLSLYQRNRAISVYDIGIMTNKYRRLPSVDSILAHSGVSELLETYSRDIIVEAIRTELRAHREAIAKGNPAPSLQEIVVAFVSRQSSDWAPWPVSVINATGVILHTNLGRAPLSTGSASAIALSARSYSDLEFDLEDGKRGTRYAAISSLLKHLVGAEAALVVNNNAGAMLLGLAALAKGKQVIVSRGEAAEIGGGFRIPEVLHQSGAKLIEVGTVNRTYAEDYENAITPNTAAILLVHRSNFEVVGFTYQPELSDVIAVSKKRKIPVLHDLGSGAILNTSRFNIDHEPMPQESLKSGSAAVFFSGDKLLGGPQAGIVVGRVDLIEKMAKHPLMRALRADKLTLAGLHATLLHYIRGEADQHVPVWRMIATSSAELKARADDCSRLIGAGVGVQASTSTLGGGALPTQAIDSWALNIDAKPYPGGAARLSLDLRQAATPVIVRIEEKRVLIDLRTVLPEQDETLVEVLRKLLVR
jgi:L-seryl-tRNA(Ser) seleniumtransferase